MMMYNLTGTEHISESWAGVIVLLVLFLLIIVGFILFWCFNTPTEDWLDQPLLWTDASTSKPQDLWQEQYLPTAATISADSVQDKPVKYARSTDEVRHTLTMASKSPSKRMGEWLSTTARKGYRHFRRLFINEHTRIAECPAGNPPSNLAVVCDADSYSQPFEIEQACGKKDAKIGLRITMSEL